MPNTFFAGIRLIRQGSIALSTDNVRWLPLEEPDDAGWLLADRVVVDLSDNDVAIAFCIGQRAALKPWTTLVLHAEGALFLPPELPVDTLPYEADEEGLALDSTALSLQIKTWLSAPQRDARMNAAQFLAEHSKKEMPPRSTVAQFRAKVLLDEQFTATLEHCRKQGLESITKEMQSLSETSGLSIATQIDMLLSLRSVGHWQGILDWISQMPPLLAHTLLVQEQRALALQHLAQHDEAEAILKRLLEIYGMRSCICLQLGDLYRDYWVDTRKEDALQAALNAYRHGFAHDWRDASNGVQLLHLLLISAPHSPEIHKLQTLVEQSISQRIQHHHADFKDMLDAFEFSILIDNEAQAATHLTQTMNKLSEAWLAQQRANNLLKLAQIRSELGRPWPIWVSACAHQLQTAASTHR